jgi:hypothetical protein
VEEQDMTEPVQFSAVPMPEHHGYDGERVRVTDVLRIMGAEVQACNEAKGWYDVNPRVEEFLAWYDDEWNVPEKERYVLDQLREKLNEMFGPRTFGDDVALLHSEVSEMLEAFRDHGTADATGVAHAANDYNPKPQGVGSEAADVLVRLLDTCSRHGIDLFGEWRRKVDYNWTRPHRHGGRNL